MPTGHHRRGTRDLLTFAGTSSHGEDEVYFFLGAVARSLAHCPPARDPSAPARLSLSRHATCHGGVSVTSLRYAGSAGLCPTPRGWAQPPGETFPQFPQNRNRKSEKGVVRLRTIIAHCLATRASCVLVRVCRVLKAHSVHKLGASQRQRCGSNAVRHPPSISSPIKVYKGRVSLRGAVRQKSSAPSRLYISGACNPNLRRRPSNNAACAGSPSELP